MDAFNAQQEQLPRKFSHVKWTTASAAPSNLAPLTLPSGPLNASATCNIHAQAARRFDPTWLPVQPDADSFDRS